MAKGFASDKLTEKSAKSARLNKPQPISIEDFWTLDVTFNEDRCRIRSLNSPQNLALLRRMALNTINQETTQEA